jgi:hypothetical protein
MDHRRQLETAVTLNQKMIRTMAFVEISTLNDLAHIGEGVIPRLIKKSLAAPRPAAPRAIASRERLT